MVQSPERTSNPNEEWRRDRSRIGVGSSQERDGLASRSRWESYQEQDEGEERYGCRGE